MRRKTLQVEHQPPQQDMPARPDIAEQELDKLRITAVKEYMLWELEKGNHTGFARLLNVYGERLPLEDVKEKCPTLHRLLDENLGLYPSWMKKHVLRIDSIISAACLTSGSAKGLVEGSVVVKEQFDLEIRKDIKELLSDENLFNALHELYEKTVANGRANDEGKEEEAYIKSKLYSDLYGFVYFEVFARNHGEGKSLHPGSRDYAFASYCYFNLLPERNTTGPEQINGAFDEYFGSTLGKHFFAPESFGDENCHLEREIFIHFIEFCSRFNLLDFPGRVRHEQDPITELVIAFLISFQIPAVSMTDTSTGSSSFDSRICKRNF